MSLLVLKPFNDWLSLFLYDMQKYEKALNYANKSIKN